MTLRHILIIITVALFGPLAHSVIGAEYRHYYETISSEITGFVLFSDGKTPANDVPIRLWSFAQEKYVYETETDDDGFYKLPKLPIGTYQLEFDRIRVELRILEDRPDLIVSSGHSHDIVVVIPRPIVVLNYIIIPGVVLPSGMIVGLPSLMEAPDTPLQVVSP